MDYLDKVLLHILNQEPGKKLDVHAMKPEKQQPFIDAVKQLLDEGWLQIDQAVFSDDYRYLIRLDEDILNPERWKHYDFSKQHKRK